MTIVFWMADESVSFRCSRPTTTIATTIAKMKLASSARVSLGSATKL